MAQESQAVDPPQVIVEEEVVIIQQQKKEEEPIDFGAAQQEIREKSTRAVDSLKNAIPKFSFGGSSESDGGAKAKKPVVDADSPPVPKSELVLSIRKNLTDFVGFFTLVGRALGFFLRVVGGLFYYFATALSLAAKILSDIFG